jgi:hypothetical protein
MRWDIYTAGALCGLGAMLFDDGRALFVPVTGMIRGMVCQLGPAQAAD